MEPWSAAEDRPAYIERSRTAPRWAMPALLALLVGAAAVYYFYPRGGAQAPDASLAGPAAGTSAPATPAPSADAAPKYEMKPRAEEALPSLDSSDSLIGNSISGLMGKKAFERFVVPESIVRHIVATVDNLPRPTGSTRTVPLHRVDGTLAVNDAGGGLSIDASNARRYTPYVRIFSSIDAHALAERYAAAYPLFQRAYEELGYPRGHFNDRLIEAIDDLLAAPELNASAKVVQSPVIYKFADPDLEGRSAGQKIMMRMGGENAAAVKSKLRQVRREIVALTKQQ